MPLSALFNRRLPVLIVFIVSYYHALGQQAGFSAAIKSGCYPLTVNFKDASTGSNINSWQWDFGNGNSSILQNPSAVYTEPGLYTVSLKVTSPSGSDTEIKQQFVAVFDKPKADFSFAYPPGPSCSPLVINFSDTSTPGSGAIKSWSWTFGDGGVSQAKNPSYTYQSPGTYTTSLTVKNEFGCENTIVGSTPIQVSGVKASFDIPSGGFCSAPANVQFTNTTETASGLTYKWDFGDGATSTAFEPSHTFTQSGSFSVSLKVTTVSGCSNTFSKTVLIGGESGADFTVSATKVCVGQPINFTRLVSGTVVSQEWSFGDGSSTTVDAPSKSYATPNKYKITYTALLQGKSCNSVMSKEIEVIALPSPSFSYSVSCDASVTFENTSTNSKSWYWDFGDLTTSTEKSPVHKYKSIQNFTITLKAFNELGCEAEIQKDLTPAAPIQAAFLPGVEQDCTAPSLSGCAPFTVQFQDNSVSALGIKSYEWDFGDGSKSAQKNPSHTFTKKGTYPVKLSITSTLGCKSEFSLNAHVADVQPTAKFSIPKTTVCATEEVKFINESTNADFYCWDFGDDTKVIGRDQSHRYAKPGKYTVTLLAKNAGCSNTFIHSEQITVLPPFVDFDIDKKCETPHDVELINSSADYDAIEWSFGDDSPVTSSSLQHNYVNTGSYTITMKAKNNSTGCIITVQKGEVIQDIIADFEVDNEKPCLGETVTFKDNSQSAVGWNWTFGDGEVSQHSNPQRLYQSAGYYSVRLQATDSDGCHDEKEIMNYIHMLGIDGDFEFSAASTCDEFIVDFEDKSTAFPSISGWQWDFGDGTTSTDQHPQHAFQDLGDYTVKLQLTNSEGSCVLERENIIHFTNPVLDFALKKSGFCVGESIEIVNNSLYADSYLWSIDNIPASQEFSPAIVLRAIGQYDVNLFARDNYGCEQIITKLDFIKITQPATDFEAFQTSGECPPLITTFQDKSTGNVKAWSWDFGDGQRSQLQNPTNTYTRPGTFDVTLVATDENGCKGELKRNSIVSVGGPYGSYTVLNPELCLGDTLFVEVESENATVHHWDFGDGVVIDESGTSSSHVYEFTSSFILNLVFIDNNGCMVIADHAYTIKVSPIPEAEFTYTPKHPFEGDQILLKGIEDSFTHQWKIGDSILSDEKDAITELPAGKHDITLIVTTDAGCSKDTTQQVFVQGDLMFIPNVFTPNDDEYNQTFDMIGLENGTWNLRIYNRWGRMVFESHNYQGDWKGEGEASGVYYFEVINAIRPEKYYKGWIHVVK